MRHPPKVKIVGSNPAGHAMFIILWGYSMKNFIKLFLLIIALSACNSVHMHPNTLDATQVLYVDAGGRIMTQKFKERMEQRGYKLTVGHKRASIKTTYITSDGAESIISEADIGRARYLVFMQETKNKFRPVWCSLNGFWWTDFMVSISDNTTGHELLHWNGRGCVNSSVRKLDRILDALEKKETF